MPTVSAEDRIGTLLEGKYRLDRILGEGGMGVVFAGEHVRLKRPIAVKFLHAHVAMNADARHRFIREAESAASIKHPNVVDVLDVGETDDGSAFMVLEYLRGDALADHLEKHERMSETQVAEYMVPVLHAVGFAHASGIVHRDLKPDNIFLAHGPNGMVIPKVLDFGIAKLLDSDGANATRTGSIMGTPLYMSPEQANGLKSLGPQADVWSLGVILFECVVGRLPWNFPPQPTLPAILVTIATQPPTRIVAVDPQITPELAAIIDRCLTHDPAKRFANATELARAIEAIRPQLRATVAAGHAHARTAQGYHAIDVDTPTALALEAPSPPAATLGNAAAAPAPMGASTAEIANQIGLPVPGARVAAPAVPAAPLASATHALWAIAAMAAIALVGGGLAMFFRSEPSTSGPTVTTVAATPPVAVVAVPAGPAVPAPAVAIVPAPTPTPAVAPSPAPTPTTDTPNLARRPRTGSTTGATAAGTTVARDPITPRPDPGSGTMRRCANGVCTDLGGL